MSSLEKDTEPGEPFLDLREESWGVSSAFEPFYGAKEAHLDLRAEMWGKSCAWCMAERPLSTSEKESVRELLREYFPHWQSIDEKQTLFFTVDQPFSEQPSGPVPPISGDPMEDWNPMVASGAYEEFFGERRLWETTYRQLTVAEMREIFWALRDYFPQAIQLGFHLQQLVVMGLGGVGE